MVAESEESLRERRGGDAIGEVLYLEVRDWREGVMEGRRTSWGGAGPSFSNDTLRPVEFLPDKESILFTTHVPVDGMRANSQ